MKQFAFALLSTTVSQMTGILGIFFVIGYILAFFQKKTQRLYSKTVGWKGILFTAWLGTPIHEIGHAFFALLFHHKIHRISLFSPNRTTGGLGHVEHSYNKQSIYQNIGNFFVGAAPLIFGTIVLALLMYYLLPGGTVLFASIAAYDVLALSATQYQATLGTVWELAVHTLQTIFSSTHIGMWQFWLFLYLSFCVVNHIAPSKEDRKGMWHGFLWVIALLILSNGAALLISGQSFDYMRYVGQYLGVLTGIFVYALVIAVAHAGIAHAVLWPIQKMK